MTSNGENPKMEVIDIEKLWNSVVDKFLIWICLKPKNDLHMWSIIWVEWKLDMDAYECVV
jgi:hypothetical protein